MSFCAALLLFFLFSPCRRFVLFPQLGAFRPSLFFFTLTFRVSLRWLKRCSHRQDDWAHCVSSFAFRTGCTLTLQNLAEKGRCSFSSHGNARGLAACVLCQRASLQYACVCDRARAKVSLALIAFRYSTAKKALHLRSLITAYHVVIPTRRCTAFLSRSAPYFFIFVLSARYF